MDTPTDTASNETCVVGCKLPHGLNLDLEIRPGDKKKKVAPVTQRIKLNGANSSHIIGGYGLTQAVPKALFLAWLTKNSALPFVRNGSVFMETSETRARDAARERRGEKTGMEPIDPLDRKNGKTAGLNLDDDALKALHQARAANPDRNRQVVE